VRISDDELRLHVRTALEEGRTEHNLFYQLKSQSIRIGEVRLRKIWRAEGGTTRRYAR
jgi:hypothetical protein